MNISELNQTDSLKSKEEDTDFPYDDRLVELEETVLNRVEVEFSDAGDHLAAGRSYGYQKTGSDDTVGAFFKEMARYPLLKPEEEVELANRVQFLVSMDELQERLHDELGRKPTKPEIAAAVNMTERQLENQLYRGRVAKRKMIRSNLRLVVSIAKRYLNRGVPFLDLIQEGALGLNRATDRKSVV